MESALVIAFLVLLALAGLALLLAALRRQRVRARVKALYRAASEGDVSQIQRQLGRGASVDLQDNKGNTALHFAYYDGRERAVARLVTFGAAENLRNREGLTAPEMATLASTEELLRRGAQCLGPTGVWHDASEGRAVYDELSGCSPHIYNLAVVRLVLGSPELRGQLLHLAIKLGISESEERLVAVLDGFGTKEMAVDYLNAGSEILRAAAERWARQNNRWVYTTSGRSPVIWGRF